MVSRKTLKKIDLENFRSESFSIRTSEGRAPASELVLQRGSLPSEIALQGGKHRVQNGVSRGKCGLGNHFSPRFMVLVPCSLLAVH